MIYDRPYMRSDSPRREISPLAWIIAATIGAFVVQNILEVWFKQSFLIERYFALSIPGIQSGYLWTFLSYGLLHAGPVHLLVNLLSLYFIGRELVPLLGAQRFIGLYVGSIILGGVAWLAVAASSGLPSIVVGCSAAVFAVLTVFACFYPDRPISFLLFFIIPITVKPRTLVLVALAISAFGLLFLELPGREPVAHSSHLGGMLAGWLYFKFLHKRTGEFGSLRPTIEMPTWLKRKKPAATETAYTVNISEPSDLKAEIDRILDKINSEGFGALTDEERRLLDSARNTLNKR